MVSDEVEAIAPAGGSRLTSNCSNSSSICSFVLGGATSCVTSILEDDLFAFLNPLRGDILPLDCGRCPLDDGRCCEDELDDAAPDSLCDEVGRSTEPVEADRLRGDADAAACGLSLRDGEASIAIGKRR